MDNEVIGYTFTYSYDNAGNLLTEEIYDITASGVAPTEIFVTHIRLFHGHVGRLAHLV